VRRPSGPVRVEAVESLTSPNAKIALIGHEKDRSSYYLHLFPEWKLFNELIVGDMNETEVRSLWFERDSGAETLLRTMVPAGTYQFLSAFENLVGVSFSASKRALLRAVSVPR
jgi:bifunctional NMN adenylyltransferase/nudix hydrolase